MVATVAVMLGCLTAAAGRDLSPRPEQPPLLVKVRYGDSLWTIARTHGDPKRDVRAVVAEIGRANEVDPARLQPGTVLLIPRECLKGGG